jgi:mono/diheme cytochrome c family protein
MALIAVAVLGWMVFGSGTRNSTTAIAGVTVPELSGTAAEGAALYTKYCAECHGENGSGADKGPPLIHKYYEPNHHPDQAFLVATLYGARQHHWKFGNMKPVEGIAEDEVIKIITYVRAVQRANGIQ